MLLIIGLDGATLDLVEPWVADGSLPNLGRLMEEGAWGPLAATIPPATFPSWTTFMTGVNPGRHGIFDFTRRDPGTYRVRFVNATFRKVPSVWRLLSHAGLRVSALGVPGTYPPEPINGYMISGFDTPVTTRADASFLHPPELAADVERHGGFPFADFQEFHVTPGWHACALESLCRSVHRKTELALDLLGREAWDCFMLMFGESDTVAHHFWCVHDPDSPRYDAALAAELGDAVHTVYQALDTAVGRLRQRFPEADVMIASDHGFGGAGATGLHLNRWLSEQGFLRFRGASPAAQVAGAMRSAALRVVPERWQARLFRLGGGRFADRLESGVRFAAIDWQGTRAFSEELNYFPSIWLNVRDREPNGQVAAAEYDELCAELTRRLLAWRDEGAAVVRRVWRRDEIYSGEQTRFAPDLILELETPGNYSYVCLPSRGTPGPAISHLSGADLRGGKLAGMSGSHRRHGLFMVAGPSVAPRRRLRGVQMADMAPAILTLCGVPGNAAMEGKPLGCLRSEAESVQILLESPLANEQYYGPSDEEAIRRRLEQLGYLA